MRLSVPPAINLNRALHNWPWLIEGWNGHSYPRGSGCAAGDEVTKMAYEKPEGAVQYSVLVTSTDSVGRDRVPGRPYAS